jgi:hypothetical protein
VCLDPDHVNQAGLYTGIVEPPPGPGGDSLPVEKLGPVAQPGSEGRDVFNEIDAGVEFPYLSVEPLVQRVPLVHGEVFATAAVVPAGMISKCACHPDTISLSCVKDKTTGCGNYL